jgi:hypothetical protein
MKARLPYVRGLNFSGKVNWRKQISVTILCYFVEVEHWFSAICLVRLVCNCALY